MRRWMLIWAPFVVLATTAQAQPAACTYTPYLSDTFRPTPAFPNQTRAPAAKPSPPFDVETVAAGLERPWAMAFVPDGGMLVTERPGRLRLVRDGKVSPPIEGLPPIKAIGNMGLFDLALDPGFKTNRRLYFGYFKPAPGVTLGPEPRTRLADWMKSSEADREAKKLGMQVIASATLSADGRRLENVKDLVEAGLDGRIVVARDGSLLVTAATMAAGDMDVNDLSQRPDQSYGKVVRVGRDGQVPRDNPYLKITGVRPELYAMGFRDPQGAALDPATGELWTIEHGPRGGDELNRVRPGRNYGFPTIGYGRQYSGALINGGLTARDGMEQPVYFWTPSIAPSGLTFYTGKLFPEWRGNVFLGAQAAKKLVRLVMKDGRVVAEESLLVDLCERIRDVRQGPEGALYVLTENTNGRILRLTPKR